MSWTSVLQRSTLSINMIFLEFLTWKRNIWYTVKYEKRSKALDSHKRIKNKKKQKTRVIALHSSSSLTVMIHKRSSVDADSDAFWSSWLILYGAPTLCGPLCDERKSYRKSFCLVFLERLTSRYVNNAEMARRDRPWRGLSIYYRQDISRASLTGHRLPALLRQWWVFAK